LIHGVLVLVLLAHVLGVGVLHYFIHRNLVPYTWWRLLALQVADQRVLVLLLVDIVLASSRGSAARVRVDASHSVI